MTSSLSLTWVDLETHHEAAYGDTRIEVRSGPSGYVWTAFTVFAEDDESMLTGSFNDDGDPMPLPSLLGAQLAAESALRWRATEALQHLGISAAQLERLGLRRVPAQPTEAGEIETEQLYASLREIVERFGAVWITGTVHAVRESSKRFLHFALRSGEKNSWSCRVSSTIARTIERPREGERVRIRIVPTVYELRGEIQLDVLELKGDAS